MDIKKIVDFCEEHGIDWENEELTIEPGYKREILWYPPDGILDKYLELQDTDEEAFEEYCSKWWSIFTEGTCPAFNVY